MAKKDKKQKGEEQDEKKRKKLRKEKKKEKQARLKKKAKKKRLKLDAAELPSDDIHASRGQELRPGTYSDGHELDDVHYLECKLILRSDRFTSVKSFRQFGELVRHAAKQCGVGFDASPFAGVLPQIREVVFFDTPDFRLYNNAFILRRRTLFKNGFPVGEPEVVFKFRHPDLQTAAETDVRPQIPGSHIMKFKAEALPLKERLGGYRLLYSHNVQFPLSAAPSGEDRSVASELVKALPALQKLDFAGNERLELVNQMIVEEVLLDLAVLDFGNGVLAKSNAALWRSRGDHRSLVGEFSFQAKFRRRDELHENARTRMEQFFITLQEELSDWVSLTATKTGIVYHQSGNPPVGHE